MFPKSVCSKCLERGERKQDGNREWLLIYQMDEFILAMSDSQKIPFTTTTHVSQVIHYLYIEMFLKSIPAHILLYSSRRLQNRLAETL